MLWHIIAGRAEETYGPCPLVENQYRLVHEAERQIQDTGAEQLVQPEVREGHMSANGPEHVDLNAAFDGAKGLNAAGET